MHGCQHIYITPPPHPTPKWQNYLHLWYQVLEMLYQLPLECCGAILKPLKHSSSKLKDYYNINSLKSRPSFVLCVHAQHVCDIQNVLWECLHRQQESGEVAGSRRVARQ